MMRIVTRRFIWYNDATTVKALHRRFCTELQAEESSPQPKEPATEAKGKVVSQTAEDTPNSNYSSGNFRPKRPDTDREEYSAPRSLRLESPKTFAAIQNNGPFQALLNPKLIKNVGNSTTSQLMTDYNRLFAKEAGSEEIRIKIKYLLTKLVGGKYRPTNDSLNNLASMISVCQAYNDYRFLSDRDIQAATKSAEMSIKIVRELSEQFFSQNRSMLSAGTAQMIIELCSSEPEYYPMIEYFRCLPQDAREARGDKRTTLNIDQIEGLTSKLEQRDDINHLALIWGLSSLSNLGFLRGMIHHIFLKSIPKIFIGTSNQAHKVELCQNTLGKLFNSVMNEKEAKAMSLYLLDVFLASHSYDQACTNLSMNLILVNRLFSPNEYRSDLPSRELRDILELLKNHKYFAFEAYVAKALPKILLNLKKKNLADSLQRNLEAFNSQLQPNTAVTPVALKQPSYLDTCVSANPAGLYTLYFRKGGEQYKVRWTQDGSEDLEDLPSSETGGVKELSARINWSQGENSLLKKISSKPWITRAYLADPVNLVNQASSVMRKYDTLSEHASPKPLFIGARNTHIRRYFSSGAELVPTEQMDLEHIIDPIKRTNVTPGSSQIDGIKAKIEQLATLVATQQNDDLQTFFRDFNAFVGENTEHISLIFETIVREMESQPTFPAFLIAMRKELNSSITEKNAETAETASLTTEYHTNLGDVQINYNKYLHKNRLYNVCLTDDVYRSLLELQSEDFSRAGFKRMIAHIFKNAKTVSPLVLRAIFGVVLKYKTPQILTDVFYLGYMKGQPWNTDTVSQFIEVLSKFKIFHEEVLSILTHYSKVSEAPIEISMISKYFDKLVENSLHQELLYFFDRVSSLTEFKQYKLDTTKTAAQNNEGLKVFEEKKLQGLKDFLSSFVDYLVQKNLLEHGELLFKNLLNKKWLGKHSDYLNGLIIYKDNLEMFDKIYQDYKARAELEKGPKEIQGILNLIVQAPLLYPNIYYDILDNYIYSSKVKLDDRMITRCIQIFDALLQFPQVMSFLNHLDKEQTQIKYYTKIKFYGLFKKCNDDELRVMLFSKLNNRILKGKKEGSVKRKLQESIEQIKTEGKNVFVTPDQSVKIYRKKEHKRNNKKENLKAMVEFYQIDYKLKPEDLRKSKTLDAPL